jgi:hypothetical protein
MVVSYRMEYGGSLQSGTHERIHPTPGAMKVRLAIWDAASGVRLAFPWGATQPAIPFHEISRGPSAESHAGQLQLSRAPNGLKPTRKALRPKRDGRPALGWQRAPQE